MPVYNFRPFKQAVRDFSDVGRTEGYCPNGNAPIHLHFGSDFIVFKSSSSGHTTLIDTGNNDQVIVDEVNNLIAELRGDDYRTQRNTANTIIRGLQALLNL